ncbi:hypothetical protein CHCC5027_0972 [Bacillus paralicheniformis]|nr:hypothetical protein CHCC5027_0972 [Bacillus paralicheniformis]
MFLNIQKINVWSFPFSAYDSFYIKDHFFDNDFPFLAFENNKLNVSGSKTYSIRFIFMD